MTTLDFLTNSADNDSPYYILLNDMSSLKRRGAFNGRLPLMSWSGNRHYVHSCYEDESDIFSLRIFWLLNKEDQRQVVILTDKDMGRVFDPKADIYNPPSVLHAEGAMRKLFQASENGYSEKRIQCMAQIIRSAAEFCKL